MSAVGTGTFTCEACQSPFPADAGGVCVQCGRTLCDTHLLGVLGRLRFLGSGTIVCVACRARQSPRP